MARESSSQYDRIDFDNIAESGQDYSIINTDPGNKFTIRIPNNSNFLQPASIYNQLIHLTVTLKIQER